MNEDRRRFMAIGALVLVFGSLLGFAVWISVCNFWRVEGTIVETFANDEVFIVVLELPNGKRETFNVQSHKRGLTYHLDYGKRAKVGMRIKGTAVNGQPKSLIIIEMANE